LIVVSDTSPILNLARIGRLELLPSLYGQVLIPVAVFDELTNSRRDLPPAINLASLPWLKVAAAKDQDRVRALREKLDPGEAEAIVLAVDSGADLLLVDERRARRIATAAGIAVTGLLGVVAEAKRAGLIDQAKPVLDELIQIARFWIGADLYAEVLLQLGECATPPR
jgi:predicted nucleic acid-binding protein